MPFCCCWNTRLRGLKYRKLGGQAIGSADYAVLEDGGDVDQILEEREQQGKAPLEYSVDGYAYRGEELDGLKHGYGTMTFPTGDTYEGEWYNDTMEGWGTLKYPNDDIYSGFFRNGMAHGTGTFTSAQSGERFEGDFKFGVRHGVGTYHFANGDVLKTDYVEGSPAGLVTLTFSGGDEYTGQIEDGVMHGPGKYTFAGMDGDYLQCLWDEGVPTGTGTRQHQGVLYDVEYEEGVCVVQTVRLQSGAAEAGEEGL